MANAILLAMEPAIDKSGRFVLPAKLREHLGVGASLQVEVKEVGDGLFLKPVRQTAGRVMKKGILIHQGEPSPYVDWDSTVEEEREEREERIRTIAGA